jgi:hypothetical protein
MTIVTVVENEAKGSHLRALNIIVFICEPSRLLLLKWTLRFQVREIVQSNLEASRR